MKKISKIIGNILNVFYVLILACGGSGGSGGSTVDPIEPDPIHTASDCSCGEKSSEGSTMALSVSKSTAQTLSAKKYVEGEVLVKFKDGTTQVKAAKIMNSLGNSGVKSLLTCGGTKKSLLKRVILKKNTNVEQAVKKYRSMPEVEYAQPNYIYKALAIPNDPDYSLSWGLKNTGQIVNGTTGTSGKDIQAEDAWNTLTDCSDVIVAVLDTGINYNHRDLSSNMWGGSTHHGYDFIDDDNDPMDMNGHGTHCAGIIGASGNDSTGLAGVCWNVQLMAVRVLDATGSGTTVSIASGIDYAVANGAHVISASLGGASDSTVSDSVSDAESAGVIIVAAAGNEATPDNTYSYPAAYTHDNIISVAAVDQDGNLAGFSNYGTTWVDIAAPGVNILSTWPGQHVTTEENFSDWRKEAGWGVGTYTYTGSSGPIDLTMLTNPSPFGDSNTYANNLSSAAYKVFDLDAYNASVAILSFYIDYDIEEYYDHLYALYGQGEGRPEYYYYDINGTSGELLGSGEIDLAGDLGLSLANSASLGFALQTDGSMTYNGAGIALFQIKRLYHNTTACLYSSGTSMATPHVSGVVAMCIQRYINLNGSYNKATNYSGIINDILSGADTYSSLSGYVNSSRMLNAKGAIDNI